MAEFNLFKISLKLRSNIEKPDYQHRIVYTVHSYEKEEYCLHITFL